MSTHDIPDSCLDGDHDWDQTNRCRDCDVYKHDTGEARFSGGAGARTHPLSDEDYQRQLDKLMRKQ